MKWRRNIDIAHALMGAVAAEEGRAIPHSAFRTSEAKARYTNTSVLSHTGFMVYNEHTTMIWQATKSTIK